MIGPPSITPLVFASSMGISGAFAVVIAFVVGGKRRWAFQVASAVALAIALLTAVALTCLWLAPWISRSWMGNWEFVRLRHTMLRWSTTTVGYIVPLGAVVGLVLGALAGLLAVLARRRPRVATGLMLGLLFAGASEPVQGFTFGLVLRWGQTVRWWVMSPGMTDPFVPASGATLGAITGALIAVVALWWKQTSPSSE